MTAHWKHTWSSGQKNKKFEHLYFSKNSKITLICIWIFKSDYRFFLLNCSFGDNRNLLFFCWPIMMQWYEASNIYIITRVKDVYQFSQSIARQKKKDNYNCTPKWEHDWPNNTKVTKNNYIQFEGQAEWCCKWKCIHMHMLSSAKPIYIFVLGAFNSFIFFLIFLWLFPVGRFFPCLVSCLRSSFSICCKAGLVVLKSLNFCLSGKLLISPSILKESLAG